MHSTVLASGLLLAMCSSVMAGQVYKWVDSQGITHFGGQPPEDQRVESFDIAVTPAKAAATEPAEPDQAADSEQRSIDQKVKKQVAEQEAERQRYCTTLRTNLAQLQNNPRVRVEEQGSVRRLNEEERQARIGETKQKIADTCN